MPQQVTIDKELYEEELKNAAKQGAQFERDVLRKEREEFEAQKKHQERLTEARINRHRLNVGGGPTSAEPSRKPISARSEQLVDDPERAALELKAIESWVAPRPDRSENAGAGV